MMEVPAIVGVGVSVALLVLVLLILAGICCTSSKIGCCRVTPPCGLFVKLDLDSGQLLATSDSNTFTGHTTPISQQHHNPFVPPPHTTQYPSHTYRAIHFTPHPSQITLRPPLHNTHWPTQITIIASTNIPVLYRRPLRDARVPLDVSQIATALQNSRLPPAKTLSTTQITDDTIQASNCTATTRATRSTLSPPISTHPSRSNRRSISTRSSISIRRSISTRPSRSIRPTISTRSASIPNSLDVSIVDTSDTSLGRFMTPRHRPQRSNKAAHNNRISTPMSSQMSCTSRPSYLLRKVSSNTDINHLNTSTSSGVITGNHSSPNSSSNSPTSRYSSLISPASHNYNSDSSISHDYGSNSPTTTHGILNRRSTHQDLRGTEGLQEGGMEEGDTHKMVLLDHDQDLGLSIYDCDGWIVI